MKSKTYYVHSRTCKGREERVGILKKYILCFTVFLCLFMIGCEKEEGRDTYEVILIGDSSSGYEWQYEENPEGIVENIRNERIESETEGDTIRYSFVFSGKSRGETELTFFYIDERNEKKEKSVKIKLHITKNRKILEKKIEKSDDNIKLTIK